MDIPCEIKERPAQPVLSIRTRTAVSDLPGLLGRCYGAIAAYLAELGEAPTGAPFAAYYNMDMADLEVEIGFPVAKALPGRGEIQAGQVPGGKLGSALHVGPYAEIAPVYDALTAYVKQQGFQPSGVAYECYLNDPQATPPAELRTEVLFPLLAG